MKVLYMLHQIEATTGSLLSISLLYCDHSSCSISSIYIMMILSKFLVALVVQATTQGLSIILVNCSPEGNYVAVSSHVNFYLTWEPGQIYQNDKQGFVLGNDGVLLKYLG